MRFSPLQSLIFSAQGLSWGLFFTGLAIPILGFFISIGVDIPDDTSRAPVLIAAWNTFLMSFTSAFFGTTLGFSFSWCLWRYDVHLRSTLGTLLKIPFLLPPFLFAMGWVALLAPRVGFLNHLIEQSLGLPGIPLYGIGGTCFVMALWSVALTMIQLQPFFGSFPASLEDAALLSGASPFRAFSRITLPIASRRLAASFLLSFLASTAAFGVPAMIASPAREYVLTTRIYQVLRSGSLTEAGEGGFASLLLLTISGVALLVLQFIQPARENAIVGGKASPSSRLPLTGGAHVLYLFTWIFALAAVVLPIAGLAFQSLLADRSDWSSITFERYAYVLTDLPEAWICLRNSALTASIAAFISVFLGLMTGYAAHRNDSRLPRALSQAWNLGYALPCTVIALSLLIFFAGSLADTIWILVLAYLMKFSAFGIRTLGPAVASLTKDLEEAAWMSGATPLAAFHRVIVGVLKPAWGAALVLSFLPMFSELTMSILLAGPGTETLGVLIYRFQEYADPSSGAVLGVLLVVLTLAFNAMVRKMSHGRYGI